MNKTRGVLTLLIITFLLSTIVLAQTNETNITKIDIKDLTPNLDKKIDQTVKIPETLQILARIIFGISKSEKISVSALITLFFIWAWVFLIIQEAIAITPFFKGKMSWLGAVIITLIISSNKIILSVARFWIDIGSSFKFLETWPTGEFIVSTLGLILAIILTLFLKDWIDKKLKRMKDLEEDEKIKKGIKIIKNSAKELN